MLLKTICQSNNLYIARLKAEKMAPSPRKILAVFTEILCVLYATKSTMPPLDSYYGMLAKLHATQPEEFISTGKSWEGILKTRYAEVCKEYKESEKLFRKALYITKKPVSYKSRFLNTVIAEGRKNK